MKKALQIINDLEKEGVIERNEKKIEDFFLAKRKRRQELAGLPIEEKVRILVQLQNIASAVYASRGIKKKPWRL